MSTIEDYTLYIKIKDGDDILGKIKNLSKGGSNTSGLDAITGGGGIWQKIKDLASNELVQLVGIGVGIGTLVDLTVKSSSVLQGVFKMWQQGFTLIFKPIGDFIGLMLRPITMAFLTQVIFPFYKYVYPWVVKYGNSVGEALVNLPQTITGLLSGAAKTLGGAGAAIQGSFDLTTKTLQTDWDTFTTNLGNILTQIPSEIYKPFGDFISNTANLLSQVPALIYAPFGQLGADFLAIFSQIPSLIFKPFGQLGSDFLNILSQVPALIYAPFGQLGSSITNWLAGVPVMLSSIFTNLGTNIVNALANIPSVIYNAIVSWIQHLGGLIPGGGTPSAPASNTAAKNRVTAAGIAAVTTLQV